MPRSRSRVPTVSPIRASPIGRRRPGMTGCSRSWQSPGHGARPGARRVSGIDPERVGQPDPRAGHSQSECSAVRPEAHVLTPGEGRERGGTHRDRGRDGRVAVVEVGREFIRRASSAGGIRGSRRSVSPIASSSNTNGVHPRWDGITVGSLALATAQVTRRGPIVPAGVTSRIAGARGKAVAESCRSGDAPGMHRRCARGRSDEAKCGWAR